MTGPNPTAATRRGHTPQTVPAPRDTAHGRSPSPNAGATQPTSEPLLLTVAQAAQRLGISRSLLYELLAAGEIESITIGRLRRVPAEALTAYIQLQRAKNQGHGS